MYPGWYFFLKKEKFTTLFPAKKTKIHLKYEVSFSFFCFAGKTPFGTVGEFRIFLARSARDNYAKHKKKRRRREGERGGGGGGGGSGVQHRDPNGGLRKTDFFLF